MKRYWDTGFLLGKLTGYGIFDGASLLPKQCCDEHIPAVQIYADFISLSPYSIERMLE